MEIVNVDVCPLWILVGAAETVTANEVEGVDVGVALGVGLGAGLGVGVGVADADRARYVYRFSPQELFTLE